MSPFISIGIAPSELSALHFLLRYAEFEGSRINDEDLNSLYRVLEREMENHNIRPLDREQFLFGF